MVLNTKNLLQKQGLNFKHMDQKRGSILNRLRLAESPKKLYTPKDSHYAYDLFMAYPATTKKT